jgi:hypothetical protein
MSSSHRNDCRIYVGNLPPDIRTKDIEDLFYKFGKISFIDLKNRRGPPFAFVEFEDSRLVSQAADPHVLLSHTSGGECVVMVAMIGCNGCPNESAVAVQWPPIITA